MSAEPLTADLVQDPPSFLRRLSRRRGAYLSFLFLVVLYASLPFVEVIAPYAPETRNNDLIYMPPTALHLFHDGQFVGPFVYPTTATLDATTFQRAFVEDKTRPLPLQFFCSGDSYEFLGVASLQTHLFCAPEGGAVMLLGGDRLGRDVFSRMTYGDRKSVV